MITGTKLGRYEIRSKIGEGGMGEVYLAQDTKLDRKVAIKFLPESLAADEQARKRLLREAQAAARLDHPSICAIHEVGEEDGRSFIVMPHVEGETLDQRMKRKPLDIAESISIAIQVADALAEAHSHSIIHRDIKPSNIMISGRGQAKIMDFGLAKSLVPEAIDAEAATQSLLTKPGTIIGTVPYMSPEQVKGEKVDARTDIFSFGVVLYEMISGRQPFANDSAASTVSAILTHEPPPLARYSADVPAELQRITRKCLEKDRERRYQTTHDLVIDLDNCRRAHEAVRATGSQVERATESGPLTTAALDVSRRRSLSQRALIAVALLMLLVGLTLAVVLFFRRSAVTASPPEIKSLAVLPLNNLSGDPAQEYFADGMTEALISNLTQIRALKVISRQSAMSYKGSTKSLPEIAAELHVDAVVEGSVQRSGGHVRVTARLIAATADSQLWSQNYDRDLSDVLRLQSEIARAVTDEIRIQVTAAESARLNSARQVDPQAHEAYLLGRFHLRTVNEANLSLAIQHFEHAIQIAPDYAAAYAGLSDAWRERGVWGAKSFSEVEAPARTAALKAVQLDPQLADAHTALGEIRHIYDWDWTGAEEEQKRALEIDPGNAGAHSYYASLLMSLGRHDEAIREMQIAQQLDPVSSQMESGFGRVLYRARKYEESIPHFLKALALDPQNYSAYVRLGDVNAKLGRYDEAISAFEKAGQLRTDGWDRTRKARVYALMGKQREARQLLSESKSSGFETASVYAALGDLDGAFRILEKAVSDRNSLLVYLKEEPTYDSLHSDPRWKELLRRMNYPAQ